MQTDEEKYLIEAIKIQQERYELAIRPYIERLYKIRSISVPVIWMDNKTGEVYFDKID
jgi:hypothetical protein